MKSYLSNCYTFVSKRFEIRAILTILLSFGIIFSILLPFNLDTQWRHKWLNSYPMSSDIIIVDIDDATLDHYKGWPLEREALAEIIESILNQKPKKLGIDIVFQERPDNSQDSYLNSLLTDPTVIAADNHMPSHLMDTGVLANVARGSTTFPLATNGKIYEIPAQAHYEERTQTLLGISLANPTDYPYPEKFYLNPNTTTPPTISALDLIQSDDFDTILTHKYVLLGSTSERLSDYFQLPQLNYVPGVVVHSIALNQVLQQEFPTQPRINHIYLFCILIGIAFIIGLKKSRFITHSTWIVVIIGVGSILLTPFTSLLSLLFVLATLISLIMSYLSLTIGRALYQKVHDRKILRAHFSPIVMDTLLKQKNGLNLGGEKAEIAVMFTDLRGFTQYSEEIDPKLVGNVLNQVLGLQADIVLQNDGVVDKYIGDAVMSFWGAPIKDPDYAYKALKAACLIVHVFSEYRIKMGYSFDIGVGLYAGTAVVGNFGSKQRFNYTIIGDAVNTASRIEGLTKNYTSKILIGDTVLERLSAEQRAEFDFVSQETVTPRGKSHTIKIYAVNSFKHNDLWIDLDHKE